MRSYDNDGGSRQLLVDAMGQLRALGLNQGAAGNISLRTPGGMLVTPTGIPAEDLAAGQIVHMGLDGAVDPGQLLPSSEWRIHADIYRARPALGAVVHCHSPYATILACARKPIPALHYMIAGAGGRQIPLADYATFGTETLAQAALQALQGASACLLANHGQVAVGQDLPEALKLAALVEELAHCHWGCLAIGGPVLLSASEMDAAVAAFASYGQQPGEGDR